MSSCSIPFFKKIIYLFIFGCAGSLLYEDFSPVVVSGGFCLVVVQGLLIAVASLIAEYSFEVCGLNSCRVSVIWTTECELRSWGACA